MPKPVLRVEAPGLLTTVQDIGRAGYQQEGMTPAGAMDPFALQVANLLTGSERSAAALEITLLGPVLMFLSGTVIALCGADLSARLDDVSIPLWKSCPVFAGQTLRFGKRKSGTRVYLALAGGLDVPLVMGSRATFLRGGIGGLAGRPLQAGDILESDETSVSGYGGKSLRSADIAFYSDSAVAHVVLGPQDHTFSEGVRSTFLTTQYTVTPQSDRMGFRLAGNPLRYQSGFNADLLSEAVPFGAIQVPPDGLPIILMADRQTTGGYPKIATVISADIPRIAQLAPGDTLSFQTITIGEAQDLCIAQERQLRVWEQSTRIRKDLS